MNEKVNKCSLRSFCLLPDGRKQYLLPVSMSLTLNHLPKSKDDYDQDDNVTTGENVQVRVEPDLELIEAGPKENDTVRFDEFINTVNLQTIDCLG